MSASRVTSQFAAADSGAKDPAPARGFDVIVPSHIEIGCTRARRISGRVETGESHAIDPSVETSSTGCSS